MNTTLSVHPKELRSKAGVVIVCCLSLVLFSFGVGRAVFSLLTIGSDRPADFVKYPIGTGGSRNGATVPALGQGDLYGQGQASDVSGQGAALDYVRYADSLGTVLSPLQVIKTMHLRDPFSAPEGFEIATSTSATSVALDRSRTGAGRSTPAGASETEASTQRVLVSYARELAESGSLAPARLPVPLEVLSGRRWTQSLAAASEAALVSDHRRAPDGVAPSTPDDVDPELVQMYVRMRMARLDLADVLGYAGPGADGFADPAAGARDASLWSQTGGDAQVFDRLAEGLEVVSRTDIPASALASNRTAYSATRVARDSVVFPWLKSATTVPIERSAVAGVAPAVQTASAVDRAVSAAVSQLSPTGVAPSMARAQTEVRGVRPPAGVTTSRAESASSAGGSTTMSPVGRSTRAVAGTVADASDETQGVDRYLGLYVKSPAGAADLQTADATPSAEPSASYAPTPVTPVIRWLDAVGFPITATDDSGQGASHSRPIGMVASPLVSALDAMQGEAEAIEIEPEQPGEQRPWWMVFSTVPRSDLAVLTPETAPETSPATAQVGSPASGIDQVHVDDAVRSAITDSVRLIQSLTASAVQKPMAPAIADSPRPLTDDHVAVPELTPVVWPSIAVTGVVVTDDGRARATVRIDGQLRVVEPGQRLGDLEVLSIGAGYLELGLGGDIRRYRIGDGGVE